jgi:hypothetical protein
MVILSMIAYSGVDIRQTAGGCGTQKWSVLRFSQEMAEWRYLGETKGKLKHAPPWWGML